jgi:hypothetical protein
VDGGVRKQWREVGQNVHLAIDTLVHDAVLEKDVVESHRRGPGCARGREERHWDAEADFGCHCVCGVWRE